jgi:hypothetical protein
MANIVAHAYVSGLTNYGQKKYFLRECLLVKSSHVTLGFENLETDRFFSLKPFISDLSNLSNLRTSLSNSNFSLHNVDKAAVVRRGCNQISAPP